jgi:glycosyltransferase involved in cell wall biosynthesis
VAARRPTILQIIPKLEAGGAELAVIDMAEAVVKAGGRALVLAEPGRMTPRLEAVGGEAISFPASTKNPLKLVSNAHAIARLIAREGVSLVHARSRAPAWSGLLAARRAKVPFVTTYHGAYSEPNAIKRAYNSVMARGDVTIANSGFTADLIAERYGLAREKIVVIHRGLDPARFDPETVTPERLDRLRQAWDVPPGAKVILQAARLTSWKGQGVLIAAAAILKARGLLDSAKVILAGDPQGRDGYVGELRQQIAREGLGDAVAIVGHVEDIPAAFLAAHVTVVPSTKAEAFGRSVTEAAAMACPVISSDIGAPPETMKAAPKTPIDQAIGWLVQVSDAEALAEALAVALALSPSDRAAMGARARAHVMAHFTKRSLQLQTLAVYDSLLATDLRTRFDSAPAANKW